MRMPGFPTFLCRVPSQGRHRFVAELFGLSTSLSRRSALRPKKPHAGIPVESVVRLCVHGILGWLSLVTCAAATGQNVTITPDAPSGTYRVGEHVTWTVTAAGISGDPQLAYEITTQDGKPARRGTVALVNGISRISGTRSSPGTLVVRVAGRDPGTHREWAQRCGAVFSPEQIAPSMQPPADFERFWSGKLETLRRTSVDEAVTPTTSGSPTVEHATVEIRARDGINVRGQLAHPKDNRPSPALLLLNGAGVSGLQPDWVLEHARRGWLVLNITLHDMPIDRDAAFYEKLSATTLADYAGSGSEGRESNYFLKGILRCYRGVEFLRTRSQWNRETLIVSGHSQGGWMAFAVAALHPAVTSFAANVPAGCDHTAALIGRPSPWPHWTSRWTKNRAAMLEAIRYYDAVNFARMIRVPGLVGVALADGACPADGILAAVNQLRGPKQVVVMPAAEHAGDHEPFNSAMKAILGKHEKL